MPHWPDRMNHVPCRQLIPVGHFRLARRAATKRSALFHKLRARRAMDSAVDTTTTQQRFVRCINDGIDMKRRNVAFNDLNFLSHGSLFCPETTSSGGNFFINHNNNISPGTAATVVSRKYETQFM